MAFGHSLSRDESRAIFQGSVGYLHYKNLPRIGHYVARGGVRL